MKILILDVGNSKCKVYVFDMHLQAIYADKAQCIYEITRPTPRSSPTELIDTCRTLVSNAIGEYSPDVGMVTAFGDAFIDIKFEHHQFVHKFVFADEPAPDLPPYAYARTGFAEGTQLTSIRRLRKKHKAQYYRILPPNLYVATQLTGNKDWKQWDWVQASISGEYDLVKDQWIVEDAFPVCDPCSVVGYFEGMPLLAGGLDNAFINNDSMQPYLIAGTWLVLGQPFKKFSPTQEQEKAGIRWVLDGNRLYNAQRVRKVSNPITDEEVSQVIDDLRLTGAVPTKTPELTAKSWDGKDADLEYKWGENPVRVFGGYAAELIEKLTDLNADYTFSLVGPPDRSDLYQHQQSALYVASNYGTTVGVHSEDTIERERRKHELIGEFAEQTGQFPDGWC